MIRNISEEAGELALRFQGKGVQVEPIFQAMAFNDGVPLSAYRADTKQKRGVASKELKLASPFGRPGSDLAEGTMDYVILGQDIISGPDPLRIVLEWTKVLNNNGLLAVQLPGRPLLSGRNRPVTAIEHIYADFDAECISACEEHRLADYWSRNPNYFPNPDNIKLVLEYLWRYRLYNLDGHARGLIHPVNEAAIYKLMEADDRDIRHHVFSVRNFLELVDLANSLADDILSPVDFVANCFEDGVDPVLVFRKHRTIEWDTSAVQMLVGAELSAFRKIVLLSERKL